LQTIGLSVDDSANESHQQFSFRRPASIGEKLSASVQITHRQLNAESTDGTVGLRLRAVAADGTWIVEGTTSITVLVRSPAEARAREESRPSFASPEWLAALLHRVSENEEFADATSPFDGSIAVNFGVASLGLRLYRGRIIDHGRSIANAATFAIEATPATWHRFAQRPRNEFISFAMADAFYVRGSMYEYLRMTKALMILTDEIRALLAEGYSSSLDA
ncbi:MAG: hypothetical protein WA860_08695, partial [Acidimicrobiales bacterium]